MLTPHERLLDAARLVLACSGYIEVPFYLAMTDVGLRWVQGLRELQEAVFDMERSQRLERDHEE